jgi:hypothetical protein
MSSRQSSQELTDPRDTYREPHEADLKHWSRQAARLLPGQNPTIWHAARAWSATLRGIHGALRPGGNLVFETSDPGRTPWLRWNRDATYQKLDVPQRRRQCRDLVGLDRGQG